jgi:hypothetical protein
MIAMMMTMMDSVPESDPKIEFDLRVVVVVWDSPSSESHGVDIDDKSGPG